MLGTFFPALNAEARDDQIIIAPDFGTVDGAGGDDIIVAWKPEHIAAGERIGPPPAPGEQDNREIATADLFLRADGGADDDWIIKIGGEAAFLVGGTGKDWIVGGGRGEGEDAPWTTLYGGDYDPETGAAVPDGERDDFWVYNGARIMDAETVDRVAFMGLPLARFGRSNSTSVLQA